MAPEEALARKPRTPPAGRTAVVLEPLTHPELGKVAIDDDLFAIGRNEQPFAGYPAEVVADLSRRHARIFVEGGDAYLADLGSKNGTTVNGTPVRQAIVRLRDGDELNLAGALAYRVRLKTASPATAPARLAHLALEPERAEGGLEPLVITTFPFLISKVDPAFARYKDKEPQQVGYLSRRHAHIFIKGGVPCVEDLGSTNGTFIGAVRLDEHAHELKDGDLLAFGGHHFVYRVRMQWEQGAPEPTATRFVRPAAAGQPDTADAPGAADKTTFVASAGSFLDIFCVEPAGAQEDEVNPAGHPAPAEPRTKAALVLTAVLEALGAAGNAEQARLRRWLAGASALLLVLALAVYRTGAPERAVQGLVERGEFAAAAELASEQLAHDANDAELRALGTEALLKSALPGWMADLRARRHDRAARTEAGLRRLARNNADALPLVAEIAWVGELERFIDARGGPDAPIRNGADAARVRQLLAQWQDDQAAHQRAFATISAQVPAFRDTYAKAASDLRKLALAQGTGGGNVNA